MSHIDTKNHYPTIPFRYSTQVDFLQPFRWILRKDKGTAP